MSPFYNPLTLILFRGIPTRGGMQLLFCYEVGAYELAQEAQALAQLLHMTTEVAFLNISSVCRVATSRMTIFVFSSATTHHNIT